MDYHNHLAKLRKLNRNLCRFASIVLFAAFVFYTICIGSARSIGTTAATLWPWTCLAFGVLAASGIAWIMGDIINREA